MSPFKEQFAFHDWRKGRDWEWWEGGERKRERTLFACYLPLLHHWLPLQFQGLWRTQFSIGDHFATIFDVRACLLGDVEMNFVAFHPWRKAQEDVIFKRQKKMCEGFFSSKYSAMLTRRHSYSFLRAHFKNIFIFGGFNLVSVLVFPVACVARKDPDSRINIWR